jgi:poly(hydroxyalkanoate) granule-associated protein
MAKKTDGKARMAARARRAGGDLLGMGQQVWLAGVGALARTQKRGPKLFDELVEEGSRTVARARTSARNSTRGAMKQWRHAIGTMEKGVETARGQASATWDQVGKMFEVRVHRAMRQLGMPTSDEIVALTRKVKELNAAVEDLARRSARTQRRTGAARRKRAAHGNGARTVHAVAAPTA